MSSIECVSEADYVVTAVEQVAAAMQADPELWSAAIILHFNTSDGVQVGMHGVPYDDVHEMASLLGVSITPVSALLLTHEGDVVLAVHLGANRHLGGIEVVWFTDRESADLVFGPVLASLLGE
jgi:hypothetical protein